MIPEITQENVRIFIPLKVSKVCNQLCKDENLTVLQAISKFYKSKTARILSEEKTKLWQQGWVGVYSLYRGENE